MDYEQLLDDLAPCGLSCKKCFACVSGKISETAKEIQRHLGNFDVYAQRFSAFIPVFNDYTAFKNLLTYFAEPDCLGCRKGTCKYPNCGVVECYQQKGVDFCFQCDEFPCDKTNFDFHLKERWVKMNRRMQEIGVEAYALETKDHCRYL